MSFFPHQCWDCPIALGSAATYAVVALLLAWLGSRNRQRPSTLRRGLAGMVLVISGLATVTVAYGAMRWGVAWPDAVSATAHPLWNRLFGITVAVAVVALMVRGRLLSCLGDG